MTHALLKGALPIYARMLAESCGVQVEFGHAIPKTDGITIFLPDLPVDDPISKALAFGLIMHEAGHVTETAFSVWPKNPVVADMVNRLEDIRMEGCQIRKYPGGRQRLGRRRVRPRAGHHQQQDGGKQPRLQQRQRHGLVQETDLEAENHRLEQHHRLEQRQQQDAQREVVVEDADHVLPWARSGLSHPACCCGDREGVMTLLTMRLACCACDAPARRNVQG